MALKIRLQRHGAAHAPVYRIVVTESTARRDGRCSEHLGHYNPKARGQELEYKMKLDRIDYWLSVGAKPTDTVRSLINRARRETTAAAGVETAAVVTDTEAAPAA